LPPLEDRRSGCVLHRLFSLPATPAKVATHPLTEGLLLEVPNGLSSEHAALPEPMAVGYHAVEKARMDKRDAPLVIGCGPVGLAVIAGHAPPAPESAHMASGAASLRFSLYGGVIRCRCLLSANATSGRKLPISRAMRRARQASGERPRWLD